ncbi:hypothetical protein HGH93_25745 [Chitinophaga polysaccharea]|uniref:hypothetical protein n=1 Tax=Chitinophaga TaxID=79328 RepID=UPI00145504ED|nr:MULTISPECIES: hypothetical protein [Chitinophaga]NLR61531.1 hypothetical protein [Chitinophaga polysaccharea]NLU93874.1 hypothetical protein [Chitinophaga sp. Ak27]
MKDVTHTPLFECMMTGEIDGYPYDLHNDYQCIKIHLNGAEKKLQLRFINDDYKIIVEFHQVTVTNFAISPEKTGETGTLDQFYRGRFKFNNNLHEISSSGKYYYYLALLENNTIELLAKRVTMAISRLNS